ncbi:hypothetical protein ACWCQL_17150 [Streptomyces sp. NPDC002073]|uniref:hypothetical protein n=1 Tax=Streptomyces sp. NBC_00239 TaxID=2903640 RepID=UPI002E2B63AB|nr:hypothetical protein [Streptomyces sp. NBC_00239]
MQQPAEPGEVTLYSGADYQGDGCAVPANAATYSLEATGLDKIRSIRVTQPTWSGTTPEADPYTLDITLYLRHPASPYDEDDHDVVPFRVFSESTPDTGEWAEARFLRVMKVYGAGGEPPRTQTDATGETVREIHDKLPPRS